MQKLAQKRSVLNRLREMTNVSGAVAEKFFNPQFQEVMDHLREVDADIRSVVAGKSIEGGNEGSDPVAMKDLLKSVKSNFNRREYMTAVAELGKFHKKVFDVTQLISKLNGKVDEVHHQFLFQDLGDEHKKSLEDIKNRFADQQFKNLIKEANIMDFFHNILSDRGRALGFYEKRYPKQVATLKKETEGLLTRSQNLLALILTTLKEMATARAIRNPEKYIQAAAKIDKGYKAYDVAFKEYYATNVKGFLEKIQLTTPTKKVENKELGNQEIPALDVPAKPAATPTVPELDIPEPKSVRIVPPGTNADEIAPTGETVAPSSSSDLPIDLVNPKIPKAPKVPTFDEAITNPRMPSSFPKVPSSLIETPDTEPQMAAPNFDDDEALTNPKMKAPSTMMGVAPPANPPKQQTIPYEKSAAHLKFMQSLESMANESPIILSSYIKKYAQQIQQTDPTHYQTFTNRFIHSRLKSMTVMDPSFYKKLVEVAADVQMKPEDILNVMAVESGIDPTAHNANGNASGLLQFMPSTLKGLGFQGSHADFRNLSSVDQLDYVRKLISNNMKFNGAPFKSAAQYYVANFLPIALKLPGIKQEDPNTIIVAKNPDHPHLPGVSTHMESVYYNANPALDANKDGVITYGDIQTVLNRAANGKNFRTAVAQLQNSTDYRVTKMPSSMMAKNDKSNSGGDVMTILNNYLRQIAASDNKKIYQQFLPQHNILIKIYANDFNNGIEFARILGSALDEELLSCSFTYTDGNNIDLLCSINGGGKECLGAVKELTDIVQHMFKLATTKIPDIQITTLCLLDKKSSYQPLTIKTADIQYRKFLLKLI